MFSCFQWLKVTKMKANHNYSHQMSQMNYAVSNGSKLLKWKQITTLQAIIDIAKQLFPMAQSY